MNENLDLVEILKDCPEGTKLYSTVLGDVELTRVSRDGLIHPIKIENREIKIGTFVTKNGKMFANCSGECVLFPSREQRDWSKFKSKKDKFDPNTLNPFDKVLARNDREEWNCTFFSHIVKDEDTYPYACGYDMFTYCIPYNDETKYLVGTVKEAPEFYRFWED